MHKFEDPSLTGGYVEIYQFQNQFKLDNKLKCFEDTFMARIFKLASVFKIELTSENNVSFLYRCEINPNNFTQLVSKNSLEINYNGFFDWLKHILSEEFKYQFIILNQSSGQLKVIKKQKFKVYEVASLPFQLVPEQDIRESVMFRYKRMKYRKQLLIDYWNKMTNIIKTKNPSLLTNFDNDKRTKKAFK